MKHFWSKVDIKGPDDCWEWMAAQNSQGQAVFPTGGRNGLSVIASRCAWILTKGPILKSLLVCHRCDNHICCNPKHLFLGTQQDNMDDKVKKRRQLRGETHKMAKLTRNQALAILKDNRPIKEIEKDYSVGRNQINRIKAGTRWKCLQEK